MHRLLLSFCLTLVACGADGQSCSEIGCVDGFSVALEAADWPVGDYTFEMKIDGDLVVCTSSLPLQSDAEGCDDERVILGASGSELPDDQQGYTELMLTSTDAQEVTVRVLRDGVELANESYTPGYEELAPNGEECGPICRYDQVTLSL